MRKPLIIAVDFDGTIVRHAYPGVGSDVGAFTWLRKWNAQGALLILYTMRTRHEMAAAILTCCDHGVEFWGVNDNPDQAEWSESRKVYAHVYVDDMAFGCPLVHPLGERPYVDWGLVGPGVSELIEARKFTDV